MCSTESLSKNHHLPTTLSIHYFPHNHVIILPGEDPEPLMVLNKMERLMVRLTPAIFWQIKCWLQQSARYYQVTAYFFHIPHNDTWVVLKDSTGQFLPYEGTECVPKRHVVQNNGLQKRDACELFVFTCPDVALSYYWVELPPGLCKYSKIIKTTDLTLPTTSSFEMLS